MFRPIARERKRLLDYKYIYFIRALISSCCCFITITCSLCISRSHEFFVLAIIHIDITILFPLAIPIRVKSKIVDAFQIRDRWIEEVALVKTEMANFLRYYSDIRIPALQQNIAILEKELKSGGWF